MNGLEPASKTVSAANTADTPHSTMTAAAREPLETVQVAHGDHEVTTASRRSQSRNDPCWPAQKPEMR